MEVIQLDSELQKKEYKPWQFKPNNQAATVNKGEPKRTTILTKSLSLKDMHTFKAWLKEYGVTRVMAAMETMDDMDFFKAFVCVAPYALPKIANVEEDTSNHKLVINVFGKRIEQVQDSNDDIEQLQDISNGLDD